MPKSVRQYSPTTIKLLFGSCGNQCAEPDCKNPIVSAGTKHSDAAVIGHICHIFAAADNGPRGKPGLTEADRSAPENLILLCAYHHTLVDKQWETYPAEKLKAWKRSHENKFRWGTAESASLQSDIQRYAFFQAYSDDQIQVEVERIRKGRFLAGFPIREATLALANRVDAAEFAGGSRAVRAKAFAWCARLLSRGETSARAQTLLEKSKNLEQCEEGTIAEAFIASTSDKARGLAMLAKVSTPAARSAALRIVANHDSPEGALAWVENTGLNLESFDADGKLLHLIFQLQIGAWQKAHETAERITPEDYEASPVLHSAVAQALLVQAVPLEFRAHVLRQVPFEADRFPLASDEAALAARRRSVEHFKEISRFANSLNIEDASNFALDYVLWLKLRDPRDRASGVKELRESLRNPGQALRRLNLCLQFGLSLDLAAIERQIEHRIALAGKATPDEAFARLALAFVQGSKEAAAKYISKHKALLYQHLHKGAVQALEIELCARAGMVGTANELLRQAETNDLGGDQVRHLRQIISEAEGADPASERKRLYDETGALPALVSLVNFLDERQAWSELLPYAEALFSRTRSLEDGVRIARALSLSSQYTRLHTFLTSHQDLVRQSIHLKTLWAWSLYREGRFTEAAVILRDLAADRDEPGDRALRINLAIASGNWDDLIDFTNHEWTCREKRSAQELLASGQLAQAVSAPHARDLIVAAAERAPNDAAILAAAYFHATNAGWEDNPVTGRWLNRAAELSGKDGPLRPMSMRDLMDRKPEWDKREASVWRQLNEGSIPVFGAAHLLNRTLVDFFLLPSLANVKELDPRRRSTIYSYSGARAGFVSPKIDKIALDLMAIMTLARLNLLDTVLSTYGHIVISTSTLSTLFQERQDSKFHQPSRLKDAHLVKRLIAKGALKVLPKQEIADRKLALEIGNELAGLIAAVRSKYSSADGVPRYVIRSAPIYTVGSLMAEEADVSEYFDILRSCLSVVAKFHSRGLLMADEEERARSYLNMHERDWPSELPIPDEAELYLDDLSVSYLNSIGVLDKFQSAGLTAFITEREDTQANQLIEFEALAEQQLEIIEMVRRALANALKAGRVAAARPSSLDTEADSKLHPTFALLGISEEVDAFVVDDRFINRHLQMDLKDKKIPILSSLDLLDDLVSRGTITTTMLFTLRASLRKAGYQLIPVTEEELSQHLRNAQVVDGSVAETAELRAIRESLLRARMCKMLQIPTEVPWLHQSMNAIARNITGVWRSEPNQSKAAALGQWLLGLFDLRGFAASALGGNERTFALFAYASQIFRIMLPLNDIPPESRAAYHTWIDDCLLKEIKTTEPELFAWLVGKARALLESVVQTPIAPPAT